MQRLAIVLIAILGACTFGDSEGSKVVHRIEFAERQLRSEAPSAIQFTDVIGLDHPYVLVLLPAESVTKKEQVSRLDLPLEAKQWLALEIDHPSADGRGPLLGLLDSEHAEWHPLDSIAVPVLLYTWKQRGEAVEITLTRAGTRVTITSVR